MQHLFSMVPKADIQRSSFNRSHGLKTTFNSGYLVPFFVDEVLPGDTFNLKASILARLSTPIVPFMDNLFLDTFFFYVPNRLVWTHWNNFLGEQENPDDTTDFIVPTLSSGSSGFEVGSLADYFGIPTGVPNLEVNSLPFRAYNLIWNEWFRTTYLQDSLPCPKGDGPDNKSDFNLVRRGKRHDYFTSALPYPQKGPGVELPLGDQAPVHLQAADYGHIPALDKPWKLDLTKSPTSPYSDYSNPRPSFWNYNLNGLALNTGAFADLSEATAVTVSSLRTCFALQRMLERDARAGGSRVKEIILAHFNVTVPDSRLQRPEYLGGSSSLININPVQQTSSSDSTSPQGNLAAYGVIGDTIHGFTHSFVEHGYIIGLVNVRADLTYQQGLNRMWSRRSKYSFYWPALANLSEQEVLNKEIYAQGNAQDDEVFGYQERWAEYRYFPSLLTGEMRSTFDQSLDVWHLSQKFESLPKLNAEFIEDNPPLARVLAVQDEPQFIMDTYFSMSCVRPMPVYSVPGLIDHF